jgi:2-polyprenyl-3-methyl-5-hydroxy-6-metoxy-1,4-benzoquinol methylase
MLREPSWNHEKVLASRLNFQHDISIRCRVSQEGTPTLSDGTTGPANAQFTSLGKYERAELGHAMKCVMPSVMSLAGPVGAGTRVLDVGCGLGALAGEFSRRGCEVVGIDLDDHNLDIARHAYPKVRFVNCAANDQLLNALNEPPFDLVTCTEVIEHVYSPQSLIAGCFAAMRPGGKFVITAPYHGYFKNLLIALLNQGDGHYNPLWEGGHIKFFSRQTLRQMLSDAGFSNIRFKGAGRFPLLWMSLVMSGDRPGS